MRLCGPEGIEGLLFTLPPPCMRWLLHACDVMLCAVFDTRTELQHSRIDVLTVLAERSGPC